MHGMILILQVTTSSGSCGEDIAKDNKFTRKLEKALKEVLYIGDGAFKVTG